MIFVRFASSLFSRACRLFSIAAWLCVFARNVAVCSRVNFTLRTQILTLLCAAFNSDAIDFIDLPDSLSITACFCLSYTINQ